MAFVGTSGVQMGWLASQADMLADDWMVVDSKGDTMILLYEDIQKTADESHIALSKLRSFLDTKEPELVKFLVNLWNNQGEQ